MEIQLVECSEIPTSLDLYGSGDSDLTAMDSIYNKKSSRVTDVFKLIVGIDHKSAFEKKLRDTITEYYSTECLLNTFNTGDLIRVSPRRELSIICEKWTNLGASDMIIDVKGLSFTQKLQGTQSSGKFSFCWDVYVNGALQKNQDDRLAMTSNRIVLTLKSGEIGFAYQNISCFYVWKSPFTFTIAEFVNDLRQFKNIALYIQTDGDMQYLTRSASAIPSPTTSTPLPSLPISSSWIISPSDLKIVISSQKNPSHPDFQSLPLLKFHDSMAFYDAEPDIQLGKGSTAQIYQGIYLGSTSVAVKIFHTTLPPSYDAYIRREAEVWNSLPNHPNIVRLYGIFLSPLKLMVMELADTSLRSFLNQNYTLSSAKKLEFAQQIALGLSVLHKTGHLHRDLKTDNILLVNSVAKLTDFGFSKGMRDIVTGKSLTTSSLIGTGGFIAPEVFLGQYKSHQSIDIYALGVTYYELLFPDYNPTLAPDLDDLQAKAQEGWRPPIPAPTRSEKQLSDPFEKSFAHLIQQCWSEDPAARKDIDFIVLFLETLNHFVAPGYSTSDPFSSSNPSPSSFITVTSLHPTSFSVEMWLTEIGMPQYISAFLEHEMNTVRRLKRLTDQSLKEELGITKFGDRGDLLEEIIKLN